MWLYFVLIFHTATVLADQAPHFDQCYNINFNYGRENRIFRPYLDGAFGGFNYLLPLQVFHRPTGKEASKTALLGVVSSHGWAYNKDLMNMTGEVNSGIDGRASCTCFGCLCTSGGTPPSCFSQNGGNCTCGTSIHGLFVKFGLQCGAGTTNTNLHCYDPGNCVQCDTEGSVGQLEYRLTTCAAIASLDFKKGCADPIIGSNVYGTGPNPPHSYCINPNPQDITMSTMPNRATLSVANAQQTCNSMDREAPERSLAFTAGGGIHNCGLRGGSAELYYGQYKWNTGAPLANPTNWGAGPFPFYQSMGINFNVYGGPGFGTGATSGWKNYGSSSYPAMCVEMEIPILDQQTGWPTQGYRPGGGGITQWRILDGNMDFNISRQRMGNKIIVCRANCTTICSVYTSSQKCVLHPDCVWCSSTCKYKAYAAGCSEIGNCTYTAAYCSQFDNQCSTCTTTIGCGYCLATKKCIPGNELPCPLATCPYGYFTGANATCGEPMYFRDQLAATDLSLLPSILNDDFTTGARIGDWNQFRWAAVFNSSFQDSDATWLQSTGAYRQDSNYGSTTFGAYFMNLRFLSSGVQPYPDQLRNYAIRTAVMGSGQSIGVTFRMTNAQSSSVAYYHLEWGSRRSLNNWCTTCKGFVSCMFKSDWRGLVLKHKSSGGTVRELAKTDIGYDVTQYSTVEIHVAEKNFFSTQYSDTGTQITVFIDRQMIFNVIDLASDRQRNGFIGFTSNLDGSIFDSIQVVPIFRDIKPNSTYYSQHDIGEWEYYRIPASSSISNQGYWVNTQFLSDGSFENTVQIYLWWGNETFPTISSPSPRQGATNMYSLGMVIPYPQVNVNYYIGMRNDGSHEQAVIGVLPLVVNSYPVVTGNTGSALATSGIAYVDLDVSAYRGSMCLVEIWVNSLDSNLGLSAWLIRKTPGVLPTEVSALQAVHNPCTPPDKLCYDVTPDVNVLTLGMNIWIKSAMDTANMKSKFLSSSPFNWRFTVQGNIPKIDGLLPTDGYVAGLKITINGEYFGSSPGNVTLVSSDSTMTVDCPVQAGDWATGQVKCTLPNRQGTNWRLRLWSATNANWATQEQTFSYAPPTLTASGIAPNSGLTSGNYPLLINGTNLGFDATQIKITFDGVNCTALTITIQNKQVQCTAPPGLGRPTIEVTVSGQVQTYDRSQLSLFGYAGPIVTGVSPSSGIPGDTVVISGLNFGSPVLTRTGATACNTNDGVSVFAFFQNGPYCTGGNKTHTQFICTVPMINSGGTRTFAVQVCVSGQTSNYNFTFDYAFPIIENVTATNPVTQGGYNATIKGSNFGGSSSTLIIPSPPSGTVLYPVNNTHALITIPPFPASETIQFVLRRDNIFDSGVGTFYYATAQITGSSTDVVPTDGQSVTFTGVNFATSGFVVTQNGGTAKQIVTNDNSFTVTIDPPAGSETQFYFSFKRTAGGLETTRLIKYAPPTVYNITPQNQTDGQIVTINGMSLGASIPATILKNEVTNSTFLCDAPAAWLTQHYNYTCKLSPGQGTHLLVSVIVNLRTSNSSVYYDYAPPSISSWTTSSTPSTSAPTTADLQVVMLTVNGATFGPDLSNDPKNVTLGGKNCPLFSWTSIKIVCYLPGGEGINLPIVVNVASRSATASTLFSYQPPTILALLPNNATVAGTLAAINGTNLGTGPNTTTLSMELPCFRFTGDSTDTPTPFKTNINFTEIVAFGGQCNKFVQGASGACGTPSSENHVYFENNTYPNAYYQFNLNIPWTGNYSIYATFPYMSQNYEIMTTTGMRSATAVGNTSQPWWTRAFVGNFTLDVTTAAIRIKAAGGAQTVVDVLWLCPAAIIPITSLNVIATQKRLVFTIPPGVTRDYSLRLTVAGQTITAPALFSYMGPTILNILGCPCDVGGTSIMTIVGTNFGPKNTTAVYVGSRDYLCPIVYANDSFIICNVPAYPPAGNPTVYLVVGAQKATWTIDFAGSSITNNTLRLCSGSFSGTLMLPTNQAQVWVCFDGSFGSNNSAITADYGPSLSSPIPLRIPCAVDTSLTTSTTIRCLTSQGLGQNLTFRVIIGAEVLQGYDLISYPAPMVQGGTIRNLVTDPFNGTSYTPNSIGASFRVSFDVKNLPTGTTYRDFVSVDMVIDEFSIRSCSSPTIYSWNVIGLNYSAPGGDHNIHALTCIVPQGIGSGHFRVTTFNTISALGTDVFNYPEEVVGLFNISGCNITNGRDTENCPTSGGVTLTLRGVNFCDFVNTGCSMTILIGGTPCGSKSYWDDSTIFCTLPQGKGKNLQVSLIQNNILAPTPPVIKVSYGSATLARISGCLTDTATGTTGCPIGGSTPLTIYGTNFSPSGNIVYIGSKNCVVTLHSTSLLKCTLPQGYGSNLAVSLIDSLGQRILSPGVTISYAPCKIGNFLSLPGITCDPCDAGFYSNVPGSYACTSCSPGTYQNQTGQSSCYPCQPGTYSKAESLVCDSCGVGFYQHSTQAVSCEPCEPGFYSNANGSSSCVPCDYGLTSYSGVQCGGCGAGYYAGGVQPDQQSCTICPLGTYSNPNATSCISCPSGFYSINPTSGCSACNSGRYGTKTGLTACEDCAIGYFNNLTSGFTTCYECPPGKFADVIASNGCKDCEEGSYNPFSVQATCSKCPQGRYQNDTGSISCLVCEPGTFSRDVGSSKCEMCGNGDYAPETEMKDCITCASGYYSNNTGLSFCYSCDAGYFRANEPICMPCENGTANSQTGQASCPSCQAGFYSEQPASTQCTPCAAGSYQSVAGRTLCVPCEPGYYQSAPGQQSPLPCNPGRYSNASGATVCDVCDIGYFSGPRQTNCTACPSGKYNPDMGAAQCLQCPPGTVNNTEIAARNCSNCPVGLYSSAPGSTLCSGPPAGSFVGIAGSPSYTQCSPGTYNNGSFPTECALCPIGSQQTAFGSLGCEVCPRGKYSNQPGTPACAACPPGRVNDGIGLTDCYRCTPGKAAGLEDLECKECSKGFYSPVNGSAACTPCEGGSFSNQSQSTCTKCVIGRYTADGSKGCFDCEPGRFATLEGTVECTQCPVGFVQPFVRSTDCAPCGVGRYADEVGLTDCRYCNPGSYAKIEAKAKCDACEAGRYNNETGAIDCYPCDSGQYQDTPGQLACIDCPLGRKGSSRRQSCDPCEQGRYSNITGVSECAGCDPGYYQPEQGNASCVACPAGRNQGATGQAACEDCVDARVALKPGASQCTTCENSQPSRDHTACECGVGEYSNYDRQGDTHCYNCLFGALCDTEGVSWNTLQTAKGYWRANTDTSTFYRCTIVDYCLGGRNSTCKTYRAGPLCSLCQEGTSEDTSGSCVPCSETSSVNYVQVVFIIIAIILVLILMYALLLYSDRALVQMVVAYDKVEIAKQRDLERFRKKWGTGPNGEAEDYDEPEIPESAGHAEIEYRPIGKPNLTYKLKIILSFFQIATNLTFALNIPWPNLFTKFVSAFNFINLDFIQWSSVSCIASINFYSKLVLTTTLPMGAILCMILFYWLPFYLHVRGNDLEAVAARNRHRRKVWKLVLFTLFLVFPKVSSTVLSLYVCREIAGVNYLAADMTLECYTELWKEYVPYDVIMILVYPLGIPSFFLFLLLKYKSMFHIPGVRLQLGFLYDGFGSNTWWFELTDMLHKLLLTSVLAFFPVAIQMPTGMCIAIGYLATILLSKPYYRKGDDRLHMFAQVELFLIMLAGFISYRGNGLDEKSDIIMSVFLIAVILGFISVFIAQTLKIFRKHIRKYIRNKRFWRSELLRSQSNELDISRNNSMMELDDSRLGSKSQSRANSSAVVASQATPNLKEWQAARRAELKEEAKKKGSRAISEIQDDTAGVSFQRNPIWTNRAAGKKSAFTDSPLSQSQSVLPTPSQSPRIMGSHLASSSSSEIDRSPDGEISSPFPGEPPLLEGAEAPEDPLVAPLDVDASPRKGTLKGLIDMARRATTPRGRDLSPVAASATVAGSSSRDSTPPGQDFGLLVDVPATVQSPPPDPTP